MTQWVKNGKNGAIVYILICMVVLLYLLLHNPKVLALLKVKCEIPYSTDSLGHQHHAKKLNSKIALHFKVLCESKATL